MADAQRHFHTGRGRESRAEALRGRRVAVQSLPFIFAPNGRLTEREREREYDDPNCLSLGNRHSQSAEKVGLGLGGELSAF